MSLRIASDSDGRARLERLLAQVLAPALVEEVVDAFEQLVEERVRAREEAAASRPWLTLEEAGEQLGCSPDAIRMRIRRGRLESRRQGRRVYVSAASVESLAA